MIRSFFFILILFACTSVFSQTQVDTSRLKPFIPKGYHILSTAQGDLNQDTYPDVVLVIRNVMEEDNTDLRRPLLLLMGKPDSGFFLKARNDNIVLCKGCGGVWGDPFEGLTLKGECFSIDHYGGSRDRWNQTITFKYDPALKDFVLYKDAGIYYDNTNPEKINKVTYRKAGTVKVLFKDYTNSLLMKIDIASKNK